jgi:hypothetical protein
MKVFCVALLLVTAAIAQQTNTQPQQSPTQQKASLQSLAVQMHFAPPQPVRPVEQNNTTRLVSRPASHSSSIKSPSYLLMLAAATAATIADCESTKALLSDPNNQEANPVFGTRPSRARIYGISVPILALNVWSSARLKKHGNHWWPLGLGAVIAAHGGAALHNGLQ